MSGQALWSEVDAYLGDRLVGPDPATDGALAANAAAGLPAIDVSRLQGRFLELLARAVNARRILEIGTLGGYSTIWMARAVGPEGRVVSLELDPRHAAIAEANFAAAGLAERITVRIGPALETLPMLARENAGPFDLIFIDADKTGYPDYLGWSLKLARPGALIIADNIVREGKLIDASSGDPNVQGVRRFVDLVAAEPRLAATVIQTVGAKHYDGFALAVVLP